MKDMFTPGSNDYYHHIVYNDDFNKSQRTDNTKPSFQKNKPQEKPNSPSLTIGEIIIWLVGIVMLIAWIVN